MVKRDGFYLKNVSFDDLLYYDREYNLLSSYGIHIASCVYNTRRKIKQVCSVQLMFNACFYNCTYSHISAISSERYVPF